MLLINTYRLLFLVLASWSWPIYCTLFSLDLSGFVCRHWAQCIWPNYSLFLSTACSRRAVADNVLGRVCVFVCVSMCNRFL